MEIFESRVAEYEEKWKTAESNLNESKASWEEQRRLHSEEVKKLVTRCEELASQNALLHEQGEKVLVLNIILMNKYFALFGGWGGRDGSTLFGACEKSVSSSTILRGPLSILPATLVSLCNNTDL